MKHLLCLLAIFWSTNSFAGQEEIKIEDVVHRISNENFNIYENALRVYQAKENITKVRGDLLPKLNVWKIVGMVFDVSSWVDRVTEVAPFLVPGNWFRLEEVKLLYLAEKEGYRALWGNEVNIAKSMYLNLLVDKQLLVHIKTSIDDLRKVHRIVKTRETFGDVPPGSAREVEIRLLGLVEDEKNLEVLIAKENTELSYV